MASVSCHPLPRGLADITCAAALLLKRWIRARDFAAETHQYLVNLEQSIPATTLAEWRVQEAEWKERVLHIDEEINLESPYELKQDKGAFAVLLRNPSPSTPSQLSRTRNSC